MKKVAFAKFCVKNNSLKKIKHFSPAKGFQNSCLMCMFKDGFSNFDQ